MSRRVESLLLDVYSYLGEDQTTDNPVYSRARLLAALNDAQRLIAVAASHGKVGIFREVSVEVAADADTIEPGLNRVLRVLGVWQEDDAGNLLRQLQLGRPPRGIAWVEGMEPLTIRLALPLRQAYTFTVQALVHSPAMHTGTLGSQSGLSTVEIALPSSATLGEVSAEDDYYTGAKIYIESGTGAGQERTITDYDGGTRTATVSAAWGDLPASGATYCIEAGVPEVFEALLVVGAEEIIRGELDGADMGLRRETWRRGMEREVGVWALRRG